MNYKFPCPNCGTPNDINSLQCAIPSCHHALTPAINVKYALMPEEVAALRDRYNEAQVQLDAKGLITEERNFEKWVLNNGKAVVNMDFAFLWEWLMHSSKSYQGYRRLVGEAASGRLRKAFEKDQMRSVVESLIFGSHVDIIYAALTLNEIGLPSYGPASVILQTAAIEGTTSLLEENSYRFVEKAVANGWFLGEPLPVGFVATWDRRNLLALAKCHGSIFAEMNFDDAIKIILVQGRTKPEDEFIELYIYGQIDKSLVEKIKIPVDLLENLNDDELDQYEELKRHYTVEEY